MNLALFRPSAVQGLKFSKVPAAARERVIRAIIVKGLYVVRNNVALIYFLCLPTLQSFSTIKLT